MSKQEPMLQRIQAYWNKKRVEKLNQRLQRLVYEPHKNSLSDKEIARQAEILIEKGANINYQGCGYSGVMRESLLLRAMRTKNHELCLYLLTHGVDTNLPDANGTTPLLYAVSGFQGLIPRLVSKGANINAQDKRGVTPLMLATKADNHKLVNYFLSKGADPNLTDQHQQTALFYAVSNPNITQTLLERGADPKKTSVGRTTPLFTAQHPKVAELLIKYGVDINQQDLNKKTALMVMANRPDLIKIFLQHGADPTICDSVGDTALHFAQNPQSISLLVEAGADIDATGFGEETPLLRLTENPYTTPETISALLQYGPKPFSRSVRQPNIHPGHVNDDDNWVPDTLDIWSYTRNPKLKQILVDYQNKWYRGGVKPRAAAAKKKSHSLRVTFTKSTPSDKKVNTDTDTLSM